MQKFIQRFDDFGDQISLNFQGASRFQTFRGGIITIGVYTLCMWQIILMLQ